MGDLSSSDTRELVARSTSKDTSFAGRECEGDQLAGGAAPTLATGLTVHSILHHTYGYGARCRSGVGVRAARTRAA